MVQCDEPSGEMLLASERTVARSCVFYYLREWTHMTLGTTYASQAAHPSGFQPVSQVDVATQRMRKQHTKCPDTLKEKLRSTSLAVINDCPSAKDGTN